MMRALPGKQFNKAAAVPGTTGKSLSSHKHQRSDGGLIILAEQPQGNSLTFLWRSPAACVGPPSPKAWRAASSPLEDRAEDSGAPR